MLAKSMKAAGEEEKAIIAFAKKPYMEYLPSR